MRGFVQYASYELIQVVFFMAQGLAHASNTENLREEVQHVHIGTSDRFVPEPSKNLFNLI